MDNQANWDEISEALGYYYQEQATQLGLTDPDDPAVRDQIDALRGEQGERDIREIYEFYAQVDSE